MALGSVSIVPFTTAELTENFGTVSIIPCTRAEFMKWFREKAYPNGRVVWSKAVDVSSTTTVPDEVDYIVVKTDDTATVTIARGGNASFSRPINNSMYRGTLYYTLTFDNNGKLTTTWRYSGSGYVSISGTHSLVGYHYY